MKRMHAFMFCLSLTLGPLLSATGQQDEAAWPHWRGPDGTGAADGNPPIEWSEEENIRWKVETPGKGSSTPIVWKDWIIITTAIDTGVVAPESERPEPPPQRQRPGGAGGRGEGGQRGGRGRGGRRGGRGRRNREPPKNYFEYAVIAMDRKTGKTVWTSKVEKTVPHEHGHGTNSQASGSPTTDGKHIYAYFGSRGVFCLDMKGKVQWKKDLGTMRTRNQFGEGGTPLLHGDTLIVIWDHEGDSFIVALDKNNGKERWRSARDEPTGWTTPVVAKVGNREQVIAIGKNLSRAYDLKTGKEIWSLSGMTTNCIPSPMVKDGVAFLMSGFRGAALQAIKLEGAKGDLAESKNLLWSHNRSTSYVPSALLYKDHLYFVRSNAGVVTCLNAKTGEVVYEGEKLDGLKSLYSSPVGTADRVYFTSRDGKTKVLAHGAEFKELATNELEDEFDASPVIIGDEMYMRGAKHLYCIAKQ